MSGWLRQQPNEFFLGGEPDSARLPTPAPGRTCSAVCEPHCQLEPPAVLERDIVLPWTVAYRWTTRAARFEGRDILGFYSGTQNSCSRELLAKLFRKEFDKHIHTMTGLIAEELHWQEERRIDHILNN